MSGAGPDTSIAKNPTPVQMARGILAPWAGNSESRSLCWPSLQPCRCQEPSAEWRAIRPQQPIRDTTVRATIAAIRRNPQPAHTSGVSRSTAAAIMMRLSGSCWRQSVDGSFLRRIRLRPLLPQYRARSILYLRADAPSSTPARRARRHRPPLHSFCASDPFSIERLN